MIIIVKLSFVICHTHISNNSQFSNNAQNSKPGTYKIITTQVPTK